MKIGIRPGANSELSRKITQRLSLMIVYGIFPSFMDLLLHWNLFKEFSSRILQVKIILGIQTNNIAWREFSNPKNYWCFDRKNLN